MIISAIMIQLQDVLRNYEYESYDHQDYKYDPENLD